MYFDRRFYCLKLTAKFVSVVLKLTKLFYLGYFVSFSSIITEKRLKGRLKTRGKSHCSYELPDLHVWLLISLVNFYRLFKTKLLLTALKGVEVGNVREITVVCFHLTFARFAVVSVLLFN